MPIWKKIPSVQRCTKQKNKNPLTVPRDNDHENLQAFLSADLRAWQSLISSQASQCILCPSLLEQLPASHHLTSALHPHPRLPGRCPHWSSALPPCSAHPPSLASWCRRVCERPGPCLSSVHTHLLRARNHHPGFQVF